MNVCIVGHGPSLRTAKLGKEIDACDLVVRLKNCGYLLAEPQNYGRRTDVMCSSTEVLYNLPKIKASEYWGWPKKGEYSPARVKRLERIVKPAPVKIPLQAAMLWTAVFHELGGKHKHLSTGLGAIVCALELKRPEKIYLAGFDKVINPETEGYQSTVPTLWNKEGKADTGHDWAKEKELLGYLQAHYNSKIIDLARGHYLSPAGVQLVRPAAA
jgi:hypothetical protein